MPLRVRRSMRGVNRRSRRQPVSGSGADCQSCATSRSGVRTTRAMCSGDRGVGALPELLQLAEEVGDFVLGVFVERAAVDALEGQAVNARREPPQPPPTRQRVRRGLPELRDLALRREDDAGDVLAGLVDAVKADEAVELIGLDLLAV